jgi:hypothetical protein
VILVVNASGFSVSVTPSRAKIRRDTSGTYAVTVAALEGFTGTVDLSATGLPSGAAAAFNPPAITTSGTSVLTVHVGNSTRTGTYKVTVSGKSGSLLPSVGIILKVR